jgi:hypothetical protein
MTSIRASAANLRLLASVYESNARWTHSEREIDAWSTAVLRVLDAADALERAAEQIEETREIAA